jgi:hypothetical protein
MSKPRKRCIFCGKTGMSKEHIWGKWLKDYVRTTFTLQRALVNERSLAGEQNLPPLVTCREVIEMATIAGAKAVRITAAVVFAVIGVLTLVGVGE